MKKPTVLSVVGGDDRQFYIADILSDFFSVKTYGINSDMRKCTSEDFSDAISSDILLLPLPVTSDGYRVNASCNIPFFDTVLKLDKKCKVCGGKIPPAFKDFLEQNGIDFFDYYTDGDVIWKNADVTAEGAVFTLMRELETTLKDAEILVCGYGRIGKCLVSKLTRLGSSVTVAARKNENLSEAKNVFGAKTDRINYLRDGIIDTEKRYDAVVNTVPNRIFGKHNACVLQNAIYVELASSPYGGEVEYLKKICGRYVPAPSLPGKYAPVTAARIIASSILKHYVYVEDSGI